MTNEKRLIDACEYYKELCEERDFPGRSEEFISAMDVAMADLEDLPIVDSVEVVRCRDCKYKRELKRNDPFENRYVDGCIWCMEHSRAFFTNNFCSYGERKDGTE